MATSPSLIMESQVIDKTIFSRIVEIAINTYPSKEVLRGICNELEYKLELEEAECFHGNGHRTDDFEYFVKTTVDKYGINFTGDEAVSDAIDMIRASYKVSVPEYQNR